MPTDRFSQIRLDSYDHAILAALQRDGRLTSVQLADEIGLSRPHACGECVMWKKLE